MFFTLCATYVLVLVVDARLGLVQSRLGYVVCWVVVDR